MVLKRIRMNQRGYVFQVENRFTKATYSFINRYGNLASFDIINNNLRLHSFCVVK